ncbi:Sec23-binding domain of Sec16-domain-containing protein [Xylariaceae sp. FL1651]|nr:Sec23-binding domain of Sec16-domain-containing protein [Xylariaceae sp. FL1651]
MDSNTQSASWHPAKMPNSSADDIPVETEPQLNNPSSEHAQPPAATGDYFPDQSLTKFSTEPISSAEDHPPLQSSSDGTFLDQFSHDEEPGAALWDTEAPKANCGEVSLSTEEAVTAVPEPTPSGNATKHLSTMSFARTVSHEVSFNDDEDTEWNLQRSETNPFSFLSENDRTNSFPVVPQLENPTIEQFSHLPPTSQAQAILQDVEAETAHTGITVASGSTGQQEDEQGVQEKDSSFQQLVGGDFGDMEQEASDTRYEEGLPLIPQNDLPEPPANNEAAQSKPTDLFAQDDTGDAGDDFFAQMQDDSQTQKDVLLDRTLQRKSTSMVIGEAVNSEPLSPAEEALSKTLAGPNGINGDFVHSPDGGAKVEAQTEDLDAKWAAAFGDDDDDDGFLLDTTGSKELDPADIFGSDDEGFLDDVDEQTPAVPAQAQASQSSLNGHYAPESVQQQQYSVPNPYAPAPAVSHMLPAQQRPLYASSNTAPPGTGYGAPLSKPELPKAQSFASKSKGGYQSPYDIPMDVVKPKKRPSVQQLPQANAASPAPLPVGPPRSASMYAQPSPLGGSNSSLSPPGSSHSNQQPGLNAQKSTPQLKSKSSFFEDLPMTSKPRPSSRQNSLPSPAKQIPHAQFQAPPALSTSASPMLPPVVPPLSQPQLSPAQPASVPALVASERVSPYASLHSDAVNRPQPSSTTSSRYSPAPVPLPGVNGAASAPTSTSRYSPAPPNSRSSSGSYSAVPPPMLAHQPRTSSPLAHFEVSHGKSENKLASPVNGDGVPLIRTSSSQYEHRVTRVPSLPPTQEVEEEQLTVSPPEMSTKVSNGIPSESKYAPTQTRRTPPPMNVPSSNLLSPSKRSVSSYTPQPRGTVPAKDVNFVPPPRSQTQSPGAVYGNRGTAKPVDSTARPSSAHGPTFPHEAGGTQTIHSTVRARGMSQHLNLVPPTDGRELDPLQRWRGAPSIAWGVGGLFVSTFPKDVPRYGIHSAIPQITRSPGEVKIQHMKDIQPLEERLAKFPGPLKGKSKKKEVIAWLTAGIDGLERTLPDMSFQQQVSHEDKRAAERALLWKILRLLVENDGVLEGNPVVEKGVREIVTPGLDAANTEVSPGISTVVDLTGMTTMAASAKADAVDLTAVESIRRHLLLGDREKAVWEAVDKRLWGHAILISSSMQTPELYRQVAQEFIKKEVNHATQGNESLAALYSVLSGNFEEAVDELVPVHARAGLQLISTSASAFSQDALTGLDKWRETLGMILSNRRQGDAQALRSLGNLLSGYGRAEAAHICYIFARNFAIFGGLDDPNANFVLVGADHRRQADQFAKETEALQLSEVYEYGLSLAPGSNVGQSCSHLAAYKLQHAMVLAEHGFRDKALQYCEGIYNAITSQTKKSPYYHPILESAVDDLTRRLKQAAGDESSSWITKPKMDQVSSNMWSRFSKFVAGPDDDGTGNGASSEGGAETGPFARIAGGTPTISPSPSLSNFEVYGTSPPIPTNKASSVYSPTAAQSTTPYEPITTYKPAPRSSMERTSEELRRASYDFPRRSSDIQTVNSNLYVPEPLSTSSTASTFQPVGSLGSETSPYAFTSQSQQPALSEQSSNVGYPGYQPLGAHQASEGISSVPFHSAQEVGPTDKAPVNDVGLNSGYRSPSYGGYEPPSMNSFEPSTVQADTSTSGYEPPPYQPSSFEPPSYEPGSMADDEALGNRPKKSFMDDDDDDNILGLKPKEKSKSEKDRENEEMFRKVAEEEAKREAEAKAAKKGGWGFGGWFGGSKKEPTEIPNKPVKAKLGEASSFVYDPDLKRWVNKKPGAENTPAKTATPPPPRAASTPPQSTASAPPITIGGPPPSRLTTPPMRLSKTISQESLNAPGGAPLMTRTVSNQSNTSAAGGHPSAPPSRPTTSLSNASSIDDLLGAAGPRKGAKKVRKSGRYVDVMAK